MTLTRSQLAVTVGVVSVVVAVLVMLELGWGGTDIQLYSYFGHLSNPYHAPSSGLFSPSYADMPPLNMVLFRILGSVGNLQVAFLAALGVCGYLLARWWSPEVAVLAVLNPLTLVAWVSASEDKAILLALTIGTVVAVLHKRNLLAVGLLAVSAAYKFLGWFMLPPLLLHIWRTEGRRAALRSAGLFLTVQVVCFLPWFPAGFDSLSHRQDRTKLDPIHASLDVLLARVGLWSSILVTLSIVAGCGLVYLLALRGRMSVVPAMLWAGVAAYMTAPDYSVDRPLLVMLPLVMVISWSFGRWTAVMVAAGISATAFELVAQGNWQGDGTVPYVLLMALVPVALGVFALRSPEVADG